MKPMEIRDLKLFYTCSEQWTLEIRAPHFNIETYIAHTKVPNTIFNCQEQAFGRTAKTPK